MTEIQTEIAGPGAVLRAARERQGLHIAALAAAIKVSPRKLEALENDRWQDLPDATFTRALAQTVCRTLKIDAKPVLDQLPAAAPVALEPYKVGLNAPFRERPGREESGYSASRVRPLIWGAGLLLVAAGLVALAPADLLSRLAAITSVSTPSKSVPVVVTPQTAQPAGPAASGATRPGLTVLSIAADAAAAGVAPTGETVFSAPPTQATAATAQPMAGAASGLVQLRTSEASWVEVRDARGSVLLSRTVMPGESVGLDGRLPIRLTIGNATATQLGFRGQNIDLSSRTRDNVARVELQ
jgi:cytoskeleton protein RodZ